MEVRTAGQLDGRHELAARLLCGTDRGDIGFGIPDCLATEAELHYPSYRRDPRARTDLVEQYWSRAGLRVELYSY